jgi:beta-phosphoglucomutase-like phosphatase (HAD superfamily)
VLVDSEVVSFRIFRECLAELGVALTLEEDAMRDAGCVEVFRRMDGVAAFLSTRISFESCGAIRANHRVAQS